MLFSFVGSCAFLSIAGGSVIKYLVDMFVNFGVPSNAAFQWRNPECLREFESALSAVY